MNSSDTQRRDRTTKYYWAPLYNGSLSVNLSSSSENLTRFLENKQQFNARKGQARNLDLPSFEFLKGTMASMRDSLYFEQYNSLGIHQAMLNDKPRMDFYRKCVMDNRAMFKDKIVLDVGCGNLLVTVSSFKHYLIWFLNLQVWAVCQFSLRGLVLKRCMP